MSPFQAARFRAIAVLILYGLNATVIAEDENVTNTSTTTTTRTATTTPWVALDPNAPFLRLGDGDCLAPGSRPVRGISRRDIDHGSCRAVCRASYCLGYSYAPCQRSCSVFGETMLLMESLDPSVWNAQPGWSSISETSGRCDQACFLRANPCKSGEIRSAGAVVPYTNLSFGRTQSFACPDPYRGVLSLICGIIGVDVDHGRCLRDCIGGTYYDRSFQVAYPASKHGDLAFGPCPRGANGNITMRCVDGEAKYAFGRCGYNCQPGSLRAGSGIVMYPAMDHQSGLVASCPTGWTGSPKLECNDTWVTLMSGRCDKHCDAGLFQVQVGSAVGVVEHGPINHGTSVVRPCPTDRFAGQIMLLCWDGQVSMNASFGRCQRHCLPGNISSAGDPNDFASARRNVSYGLLQHATTHNLTCNPGYFAYPEDMLYVVGDIDQLIYQTPLKTLRPTMDYGVAVNEYKRVLSVSVYDGIMYVVGAEDFKIYRQAVSQLRPTSFWDDPISETLECIYAAVEDAVIYAIGKHDGLVYKQPLAGMRILSSWTKLTDEPRNISAVAVVNSTIYAIDDEERRVYKHIGLEPFANWTGPISGPWNLRLRSLKIINGTAYVVAKDNIYMQKLANMTTSTLWQGPLSNEQPLRAMTVVLVNTSIAPSFWMPGYHGTLEVRCTDGAVQLLEGECRMDCAQGQIITNNVVLSYHNASHGENESLTCPANYSGDVTSFCDDGRTYFEGSCGLNCAPMQITNNGANVTIPLTAHSDDETFWTNMSCPDWWYGNITYRCFMGEFRWFGRCLRSCNASRFTTPSSGGYVDYPQMNHTQTYEGKCVPPPNSLLSYTGSVQFECIDGEVKTKGRCYGDCTNGTITNNGVEINFGLIPFGQTLAFTCVPSSMYGIVNIKCELGNPVVVSGTCGIPCNMQLFKSAATKDYNLELPEIAHSSDTWVDCPAQVSGKLHFTCNNNLPSVIGGSCGARCPSKALQVYGATFATPLLEHQASFEQECLDPYKGKVSVYCDDSKLTVNSGCQRGCYAGNITLPSGAFLRYPNLISGDQFEQSCPEGYTGYVTLQCGDVKPFVYLGDCFAHCMANRFYTDLWNVEHGMIYHGQSQELSCPEGFDGYVILNCAAGTVTLQEGGCYQRCPNGRFVVRLGIVMRYAEMAHLEVTPSLPCPEGFAGSVRLKCTNGVMAISEGGCPAHCEAGAIQGAAYKGLLHTETASLVCPISGTLLVNCYDGVISVLSGKCIVGCKAGSLTADDGSVIMYPAIEHMGNVTGTCSGTKLGFVQVNCSDGLAMLDPLLGQRCYSHCATVTTMNTPDGSSIDVPPINHNQEESIKCPNSPGSVFVRCEDGVKFVASGTCGPTNCAAGSMLVGPAEVQFLELNDGFESDKPSTCPDPYMGEATFSCSKGVTSILNVTLIYPAIVGSEAMNFSVADATPEFLDLHDQEYFRLCGCCIPAGTPDSAAIIPGIDLRKIIVWALVVAGTGVLLATVTGCWMMRSRKKLSRIAPDPSGTKELGGTTASSQALALKNEIEPTGAIVAYNPPPKASEGTGIRALHNGTVGPDW